MKSLEQRASLYAILSGCFYGSVGYFGISAIQGNLSISTMLFWRFFISSFVIFILLIPQLKKNTDSYRNMGFAFLNGAFYYGISTLLYFYSSKYIGSGLAMVVFYIYPVLIILLNYFFYRELIPKVYYLSITIILIGMLFLIDMNTIAFDLSGIALGIASSLFYAGYLISSKRNKISPNMSTLMVCLGCMVTSFIFACASHTFAIPSARGVWFNLLGIGLLATVIPILLMLYSLKYISSERASILSVLEPVFVVILGVLFLGEELHSWDTYGIILVLSGALITLFSHKINIHSLKKVFS